MIQKDPNVNRPFEEKRTDTITIEVRPRPTGGPIGKQLRNDAPFVSVKVSRLLSDACRALDRRQEFGVHISEIGGIDVLAEFAMHGIRVLVKAFSDRGTGREEVWAVPRCDFRFLPSR